MNQPPASSSPPAPPYPATAPPYPGAPPPYPAAAPVPAPPPIPSQHYQRPTPAPLPPPTPPRAEEQLAFHAGRVHLSARRGRVDSTTVGQLILHVPAFACSLTAVVLVSLLLPTVFAYLLVMGWVLSGVLAFHRPTERFIARYLLNLRYPTRAELAHLGPIWREVTARAGVESSTYDLWIEDSPELNAYAAAGHIVGVTRYSLQELPPAQLAGVLAHELGHHTGGHAWSSLLGLWYSLPGRIGWRVLRFGAAFLVTAVSYFSYLGATVCALTIGALVLAVTLSYPAVLLLLVTPYLLAALNRRAELRADRHAAELGFAPMMIEVLNKLHAENEAALRAMAQTSDGRTKRPGTVARLLSSHPDHHTRIHLLESYLSTAG